MRGQKSTRRVVCNDGPVSGGRTSLAQPAICYLEVGAMA